MFEKKIFEWKSIELNTKGNSQNNKDKLPTEYIQVNSKLTKDLYTRHKTLKRKHSYKSFDLGLGNNFLDITPSPQVPKDKIDDLDLSVLAKGHHQVGEKTIHRMGEILQIMCLIKSLCPEYMKNFYN